jgi:DNA-binding SARP family transcriptional activator
MSRLRITLLGSFAVSLDDEPVVDFHYEKARALLALIALEPDHAQSRERIAGMLWPDVDEGQARRLLRTVLYRLRVAIHDDEVTPSFLLVTRDTLQLNPDASVDVDAVTFRELVAEAQTHAHDALSTCPACVDRLTRATHRYAGELLAGFSLDSAPFEGWLVNQRQAFHRQALEALNEIAEYHLAQAGYDQALAFARRQIALEPWQERAHRQAMRALTLSGQRAATLR